LIKPRWPVPGDTPLDQARTIARGYRAALHRVNPELCATLDRHAHELGQTWITPQPATADPNTLMTARDLAEYLGPEYSVDQIRQWATRGHILRRRRDDGRTVYRLGDAQDHIAHLRRQRTERGSRQT
jgi:hypothetical protein